MELTTDSAIKLHRALWDWLAKNPGRDKEDWPGWKDFSKNYPDVAELIHDRYSSCFACYVAKLTTVGVDCAVCPFEWPGLDCLDLIKDNDGLGLFSCWDEAASILPSLRSELAAQIRDLPIRERYLKAETTADLIEGEGSRK